MHKQDVNYISLNHFLKQFLISFATNKNNEEEKNFSAYSLE